MIQLLELSNFEFNVSTHIMSDMFQVKKKKGGGINDYSPWADSTETIISYISQFIWSSSFQGD